MPSSRMTALLALLAVAGYQNRDKLGDIFGRITGQRPFRSAPPPRAPLARRPQADLAACLAVCSAAAASGARVEGGLEWRTG